VPRLVYIFSWRYHHYIISLTQIASEFETQPDQLFKLNRKASEF